MIVKCAFCGKDVLKPNGEYNRSLKMGRKFYCDNHCSSAAQPKAPSVNVECPVCKKFFPSSLRKRAAKFCSRACASKGSVTDYRRQKSRESGLRNGRRNASNLLPAHETLKRREAWKYEKLKEFLKNEPHDFEYPIGSFVYDLVLFNKKILVEFDGPYHSFEGKQNLVDLKKNETAELNGYKIIRVITDINEIISPDKIKILFD